MKVLLHVNYVEGPGDCLERLFALASRAGCDGVELRWKYRFPDRTQEEYCNVVAGLKQRYPEMEITFGGCIDFCRGKKEDVAGEVDAYVKFLEWAKNACGTPVMNFFTGSLFPAHGGGYGVGSMHVGGSGIAAEDDFERSAAGLRALGDAAAPLGIRLALETHNGYLHDLAKPCAKLMAMTDHPAIGINYDQGNIILNKEGESVDQVFELLPEKIYYAHLKNMMLSPLPGVGHSYAVTRLSDGYIDQYRVMQLLKKHLKGDMIAIEYPCPGDGVYAALKDMEYIQFLKNELNIQ